MYVSKPCACRRNETYIHSQSCLIREKNHPQAPPKHVCMFQKPCVLSWKWNMNAQTYTLKLGPKIKPYHILGDSWACMYVWNPCVLSWKTKRTRSNMNLRTQLKLLNIEESATPIEESACWIITKQRKRYPYRGIVRCTFRVCFKILCFVVLFALNPSATQPKAWVFEFTPTRRLY